MRNRIFRGIFCVALAVWLACLVLVMGALYTQYSKQYNKSIKNEAYIVAKAVDESGASYFKGLKLQENYRITMDISIKAFDTSDVELAARVEPLEQVIDGLTETIKLNHINRLQKGECTIKNGFVLSDILNNYERVSDHCSNIAVAIIELEKFSFDTHEYLNQVKSTDDSDFRRMYNEYKEKYVIS